MSRWVWLVSACAVAAVLLSVVLIDLSGATTSERREELLAKASKSSHQLKGARSSHSHLAQSGAGLVFTSRSEQAAKSWDLQRTSRDARLADQIQKWDSKDKHLQSVAKSSPSDDIHSLKSRIKSAVQELRLSDFLTGVTPAQTEKQVQMIYQRMDPKDLTKWKHSTEFHVSKLAKSKKAQLKEISTFQKMLEHDLTTTTSQDTASAKTVRKNLRELLLKRRQLQAAIEASEDHILKNGGATDWTTHIHPDPAQSENVIDRLARPSDAGATYSRWLAQQAAAKAAPKRGTKLEASISAGGGLVWKKKAKVAAKARMESLAGRDPLLRAKGDGKKPWHSIKQQADERVARWMGAGYYPVFG